MRLVSVVTAALLVGFAAAGNLVATGAAPAAQAAETPTPTRLVHGPAVLRLTNLQSAGTFSSQAEWRYLVLFKLNQDIVLRPYSRQGEDWMTTRGNFRIAGFWRSLNLGISKFGSPGCLAMVVYAAGTQSTEGDPEADVLDKLRVGGRVKISLQPLTPGPNGRAILGKTYVSYPRLQTADVLLKGKRARQVLKRLGCANRPLP